MCAGSPAGITQEEATAGIRKEQRPWKVGRLPYQLRGWAPFSLKQLSQRLSHPQPLQKRPRLQFKDWLEQLQQEEITASPCMISGISWGTWSPPGRSRTRP